MAIEIWELPESGRTEVGDDGSSFELKYAAKGTDSKLQLLAEIEATETIPDEIDFVPRKRISLQVMPGHTSDWFIDVEYSNRIGGSFEPTDIGDELESFSTGGGSTRLYQALEHVADYAVPGRTATNHGGAINVTPDRVEGVDVQVPVFVMRIVKILPASAVTPILRASVYNATGAVNSDTFRGFQPGELRLVRGDLNQRDAESWTASYEFHASQNLPNLTLGEINGISKDGQDYLWGTYEDIIIGEGTESARAAKRLIEVHIERTYPRTPFNGVLEV